MGHPVKEREAKSVDEYAKELNQWLKKMRCTGVTGVRLESFVDIKIGISEEPLDPSSPSLEPYPHLWKEKFTYKGYKDECGRLKGKAFIELENGDTISGSFHEGLRHGECRIETGKNGINFLVGNYVRDQVRTWLIVHYLQGIAVFENHPQKCQKIPHFLKRKLRKKIETFWVVFKHNDDVQHTNILMRKGTWKLKWS